MTGRSWAERARFVLKRKRGVTRSWMAGGSRGFVPQAQGDLEELLASREWVSPCCRLKWLTVQAGVARF